MGAKDLTLAMRLQLDSQKFVAGLTNVRGSISQLSSGAREKLGAVREAIDSVQGRLVQLGLAVGAVETLRGSAQLDKRLTRIGLAADASESDVAGLRKELLSLSTSSAQSMDDLVDSFDLLMHDGNKWQGSLEVLRQISKVSSATGESMSTLAEASTNAAAAFKIDLSKPNAALDILTKMIGAADKGKAKVGTLAIALERIGPDAKNVAGLSYSQTLSMMEVMAARESQPRRLLPMFESTIGLFDNKQSILNLQRATGIHTFENGEPRNMLDILQDVKQRYDQLPDSKRRMLFMSRAFQGAGDAALTGVTTLMADDNLQKLRLQAQQLEQNGGSIDGAAKRGTDNAIDQVARLAAALREAADGFAKPINGAIDRLIKYALDSKQDGGLGLSGKEVVGYGAGAIAGGYVLKRYGGAMLSKLFGKAAGLGEGVAIGKGLQQIGVTPVYVVNMPTGGIGDVPNNEPLSKVPDIVKGGLTASLLARAGLVVAGTAALSYGAYRSGIAAGDYGVHLLVDKLNSMMRAAQPDADVFGSGSAANKFEGNIKIEVASSKEFKTMLADMSSNSPSMSIDIDHRGAMGVFR